MDFVDNFATGPHLRPCRILKATFHSECSARKQPLRAYMAICQLQLTRDLMANLFKNQKFVMIQWRWSAVEWRLVMISRCVIFAGGGRFGRQSSRRRIIPQVSNKAWESSKHLGIMRFRLQDASRRSRRSRRVLSLRQNPNPNRLTNQFGERGIKPPHILAKTLRAMVSVLALVGRLKRWDESIPLKNPSPHHPCSGAPTWDYTLQILLGKTGEVANSGGSNQHPRTRGLPYSRSFRYSVLCSTEIYADGNRFRFLLPYLGNIPCLCNFNVTIYNIVCTLFICRFVCIHSSGGM